jgi:hypothetical protein
MGKTALNTTAIVAFSFSCIPVLKDKYENSILGQVVSYTYTLSSANNITLVPHAFFASAGSVKDLGRFGPNAESQAFAINSSGEIVGTNYNSITGNHGFLYRGCVMLDVNSLLPPNSGWAMTNCKGINDNGQICGDGLHNGVQRAFLLTLTPSGVALRVTRVTKLNRPAPPQRQRSLVSTASDSI